jgi:hypothetical protein
MKCLVDVFVSFFGLLFLAPVLLLFMLLIWLQDWHSPFLHCAAGPATGPDLPNGQTAVHGGECGQDWRCFDCRD